MQSVFNISMRMQYRVVTYEEASDEETLQQFTEIQLLSEIVSVHFINHRC